MWNVYFMKLSIILDELHLSENRTMMLNLNVYGELIL